MADNKRETGSREPVEDHRAPQTDQDAALPAQPEPHGLTAADPKGGRGSPQADAKGAGARTTHGGDNDGVVSADPRVLSGKKSGDATFENEDAERE